jgi:hypothetical protein
LTYLIFYSFAQPYISKNRVTMEILTEYLVLVLSYHMFLFTDFTDMEVNYALGLSFVFNLVVMLAINMFNMFKNTYMKYLSQ